MREAATELARFRGVRKREMRTKGITMVCAGAYFKQSYLHRCFSGAHVRSEALIQVAAQRSKHTASLVFSARFRYSLSSQ